MIKSMTGYGSAEAGDGELTTAIEIRGYNSRFLDVIFRMPHYLNPIEESMKGLVEKTATRGRIEIRVEITDASCELNDSFKVNIKKANAYSRALEKMKEGLGLKGEIPIETIIRMDGIIEASDPELDSERYEKLLLRCLQSALNELDKMKCREGESTAIDMSKRMDLIESYLKEIVNGSEGLLEMYQERLKKRIQSLTRGIVEIDSARLAQEAAYLSDRSDISEEVQRARSHIRLFRDILKDDAPAGRKLGFLLQEFNREFNTMGSKIGNAEVAHKVVAVKTELEKIREQVQNIE